MAATHKLITATLSKTGWVKVEGKDHWKQNINDPAIVDGLKPEPATDVDTLMSIIKFGSVISFDNIDGVITANALYACPSTDITVQLTLMDVAL